MWIRWYYSTFNFQSTFIILSYQKKRRKKHSSVVLNPQSLYYLEYKSTLSAFFNSTVPDYENHFFILNSIQLYNIMLVTPNPSDPLFWWNLKCSFAVPLCWSKANRDRLISKCRLPPADGLWSLPPQHSSPQKANQSFTKGCLCYVVLFNEFNYINIISLLIILTSKRKLTKQTCLRTTKNFQPVPKRAENYFLKGMFYFLNM